MYTYCGFKPGFLLKNRNLAVKAKSSSNVKVISISKFMDSLPTKIGKVSICFDGSINDGYLRFQIDHHPDSLPDFNISIKDGKAVKFIEPHLGSSYRAIEELINHKFDGIPRELVDFIHINKPDSTLEKSMCFGLNITRGAPAEVPSPSKDDLPRIENGHLLDSDSSNTRKSQLVYNLSSIPIPEWAIKGACAGKGGMKTNRGYGDYAEAFNLPKRETLLTETRNKGGSVHILDSGCGKGYFLTHLNEIKREDDSVTGFDMNKQDNDLVTQQDAIEFLKMTRKKFNLIFDSKGPFSYSGENCMQIFKLTIESLERDGVAYISENSDPESAKIINKSSAFSADLYWTNFSQGHYVCTDKGILSFKTWVLSKIQTGEIMGIEVIFPNNMRGGQNEFLKVTRREGPLKFPAESLEYVRSRYGFPPLVYWQEN